MAAQSVQVAARIDRSCARSVRIPARSAQTLARSVQIPTRGIILPIGRRALENQGTGRFGKSALRTCTVRTKPLTPPPFRKSRAWSRLLDLSPLFLSYVANCH
jgi:hypothetical protein